MGGNGAEGGGQPDLAIERGGAAGEFLRADGANSLHHRHPGRAQPAIAVDHFIAGESGVLVHHLWPGAAGGLLVKHISKDLSDRTPGRECELSLFL